MSVVFCLESSLYNHPQNKLSYVMATEGVMSLGTEIRIEGTPP